MDLCLNSDSGNLWKLASIRKCKKCNQEFCQDAMHYFGERHYISEESMFFNAKRREFRSGEDFFLCSGCFQATFHVGDFDDTEGEAGDPRLCDVSPSSHEFKRQPRTSGSVSIEEIS